MPQPRTHLNAALLQCLGLSKESAAMVAAEIERLESEIGELRQRATNAEMELLALKSPIPPEIRRKMDADRRKAECKQPEWLSQALNEGDGTYKP